MTQQIQQTLRDSKAARWAALVIVSFTMMWGYFLTDAMSPLMTMLEVEMHWSSSDFGIFNWAYCWFNVFLLMLIFGGMILDKLGVRITGVASCALMVIGAFIKYYAVSQRSLSTRLDGHECCVPFCVSLACLLILEDHVHGQACLACSYDHAFVTDDVSRFN